MGIEYLTLGTGDLVVVHLGMPSAAAEFPHIDQAAEERGLRMVIYSRPG